MINDNSQPRLFGLTQSNRDFSHRDSWGKNQFNNSFPAALACYMHQQGLEPVYLVLDPEFKVKHEKINVTNIFGISPLSSNLFFAFESDYVPYRKLVTGRLPRVDLVTLDTSNHDNCLRSLEIKLTALPDNSTYRLNDDQYGCEIVTRPDTIVYLALSIGQQFQESRQEMLTYFNDVCCHVDDWLSINSVLPLISAMVECLDQFLIDNINLQQPLVMQPVWKTIGKTSKLCENCLDIFVWSNFAFTRLFVDVTKNFTRKGEETIQRPMRSLIWLIKMLYDFAQTGKIAHRLIIDNLTYHTKNDKAFALSGYNTRQYMASLELSQPRVTKADIKNIILGRGQDFLSPERRFDAIILSNPDIFTI